MVGAGAVSWTLGRPGREGASGSCVVVILMLEGGGGDGGAAAAEALIVGVSAASVGLGSAVTDSDGGSWTSGEVVGSS
jgi:hypothetical protein